MPSVVIASHLATRVRAALSKAGHDSSMAGSASEWKRTRDAWLDRLDPAQVAELRADEVGSLIDLLSECGPGRASRLSRSQWNDTIAALVPELLYARSASSRSASSSPSSRTQ
jgi:hypothetical protein